MPNSEPNDEVSDTTGDDSSNAAGYIILLGKIPGQARNDK